MSEKLTGAQALIRSLEKVGVDVVFGLPGGAILPVYDPLLDSPIRHVLVRHEQGAGHMAEGYAWATGRVGVCMATSGPGATNLVTPLTDALMDSVPIVAITGQVPTTSIGLDAFQECDTTGITMPCTKHNYLITDADDIPTVVQEAFHIASTGRPGPVLIDLPKNVSTASMRWNWPDGVDLPGYKPTLEGHPRQIKDAVELILAAKRPVLYTGGGIIKSGASPALLELAELLQIPVVTTLMNRGGFPDDHPLCLGMPGMHGNYAAVTSMQKADLLIAIGARFDDRVTGKVAAFAPDAKVIHVDVDPAEISKVRGAVVPIVGACDRVLAQILREAHKRFERGEEKPDYTSWLAQVLDWKQRYPYRYTQGAGDRLKPEYVVERLYEATGGDATVVAGVGQHQMWASQYWRFNEPRRWINSGGLGTMGFAVPAAIGAKVGQPESTVWAIDGDGCFQMTMQEMITAAVEQIPVKIAVINNAFLGMVRQWQELFYAERFSQVELGFEVPDYVKLAEAMGCVGLRAEKPEEVDTAIGKAMEVTDRPVVVEFRCDPEEKVYPMVPAGASNDDIILGPSYGDNRTEDDVEIDPNAGSV